MEKYRPSIYFSKEEERTIKMAALIVDKKMNDFCRELILDKSKRIMADNSKKKV